MLSFSFLEDIQIGNKKRWIGPPPPPHPPRTLFQKLMVREKIIQGF